MHNPSYAGGRDQEDHDSKSAWTNSSRDFILKIPAYTHKKKQGWQNGSDDIVPA
jgi:hypothetical protein